MTLNNGEYTVWQCSDEVPLQVCCKCGKEHEGYAVILDSNPLSIFSYLEERTNDDGSFKNICKECWDKKVN